MVVMSPHSPLAGAGREGRPRYRCRNDVVGNHRRAVTRKVQTFGPQTSELRFLPLTLRLLTGSTIVNTLAHNLSGASALNDSGS